MAKSSNEECEFICGDAFNLSDIPDKQFDLVYSLGFLEHYKKRRSIKINIRAKAHSQRMRFYRSAL